MLPSCCTAEQNNFHKEPSMVPQSRISSPLKHNLIALRSPHSAIAPPSTAPQAHSFSVPIALSAFLFSLPCFCFLFLFILLCDSLSFFFFPFLLGIKSENHSHCPSVIMSGKYIISAILGSFGVAWVCDYYVSEKKLFGGSTPGTITNNEWAEETDKKLQAWPRTAGPPVVMNPISRRNFIWKRCLHGSIY
ncbi:hypothetical protein D0Y65_041676 [Glycine soja]|uniref:Uncharacterized protein n=1 Tax=Glycine soja TaxID=3848 RepID=A0A445GWS2_GLYSO|nr:hypothetical protein D0Y65_041676 [Glycine soja]